MFRAVLKATTPGEAGLVGGPRAWSTVAGVGVGQGRQELRQPGHIAPSAVEATGE